jgi:DNA-directed RNA polymerase specialized sigma24 family protein
VQHVAVRWARRARLREPDIQDAKQTALMALVIAAWGFQPAQPGGAGCRFGTYAWTFVTSRMKNFLRGLRRYEGRLCRSVPVDWCEESSDNDERKVRCRPRALEDPDHPALIAQTREYLERFAMVVSRLTPDNRFLWDCLAAEEDPALLAAEWHVSRRTLQRRLAGLQKELEDRLCECICGVRRREFMSAGATGGLHPGHDSRTHC